MWSFFLVLLGLNLLCFSYRSYKLLFFSKRHRSFFSAYCYRPFFVSLFSFSHYVKEICSLQRVFGVIIGMPKSTIMDTMLPNIAL